MQAPNNNAGGNVGVHIMERKETSSNASTEPKEKIPTEATAVNALWNCRCFFLPLIYFIPRCLGSVRCVAVSHPEDQSTNPPRDIQCTLSGKENMGQGHDAKPAEEDESDARVSDKIDGRPS
jgi:hypothetical protein